MSMLSEIGTGFSLWIDAVARTVKGIFERLESTRRIELAEDEDGAFTIRPATAAAPATGPLGCLRIVDGVVSGLTPESAAAFRDSRVELTLRSSRFLFRPLDLPKRASEFLDGIVRA